MGAAFAAVYMAALRLLERREAVLPTELGTVCLVGRENKPVMGFYEQGQLLLLTLAGWQHGQHMQCGHSGGAGVV